jgi:hypothetical protein
MGQSGNIGQSDLYWPSHFTDAIAVNARAWSDDFPEQ